MTTHQATRQGNRMAADTASIDDVLIARHSVTDCRVTVKGGQIDIVGKAPLMTFGPQGSLQLYSPANMEKRVALIMEVAERHLTEFEKLEVYRQMIATRAQCGIDGQKRLRIPPSHMAHAGLYTEHPEVDIIMMSSGDCQWLEMWPAGALSSSHAPDDPYNRAYQMLVGAMKKHAEVEADVA
ncbi:MAG TPA: hypothetical protein DGT21_14740 [Armatimonadetes bacterium]|nr:hypothetical protein [Armatimonadota bacterium]